MSAFNIGLSALRANQVALQTISNNIANASTEGYIRQRVQLTEATPFQSGGLQLGNGVLIAGVERVRDQAVETSLTLNLSQSAAGRAGLEALQQIERIYTSGTGSLTGQLSQFFNQVEQLSVNPTAEVLKRGVLSAAQGIAQQISSFQSDLSTMRHQVESQIQGKVDRVNELTKQISELTSRINTLSAAGQQHNTLLDQRDQLIRELGTFVDLSAASLINEGSALVAADGWLVIGETVPRLSTSRTAEGTLELRLSGGQGPVTPLSGELSSLLTVVNQWIPETIAAFQDWSRTFVGGINAIMATGLTAAGPAGTLTGSTVVAHPDVPLAQAGLVFPVQKGRLHVTVTDNATGRQSLHSLEIDVNQDSLQDVLDRLDALPNVDAAFLAENGRARISGAPGYTIDFTGRPQTLPDTSAISGTARPTVQGLSRTSTNSDWIITASGEGVIGVTPGLKLLVTDAKTGNAVAELNVGSGYQANQPLEIAAGLSLSLTPGTVMAGDQFHVAAIGTPDSTGLLAALGINALFETNDLLNVQVSSSLIRRPELLATSRTGAGGDNELLMRVTGFRQANLFSQGTENAEDRLASMTSSLGVAVNAKRSEVDQLSTFSEQLKDLQSAVSGVDPNEELLLMLQFQRSFQASARFLSTLNETLDDLLGLVR
ncbi:flagellar hook-associated protein FlgK [Planctomicrobium sp. SH664]|uniref:flagellar hook-associated protein FlgK n=1 Tax=Planctomicrobium sp. SH664 TaxID=3448125 RepID=UPI003F5B4015